MSQSFNHSLGENRRLGLARFPLRARLILLAALVVLVMLAILVWLEPVRSTATYTVDIGDINASVNANARVRATHSARLSFSASGKLKQVNVAEGNTVKAGTVLAELESDEFDRRVKQAELALASRKLDLERAQAAPRPEDLNIAQSNLKKAALALAVAEDNAKKNATTANDAAKEAAQADYDIARANFDRLTRGPTTQELQLLNNAVSSAQLELDAANAAQANARLKAPYDGIVTEVNAQPGELVGAFNPVIGVADLRRLELFADIDEIDVGAVVPGQSVEIHFDAFPGETLKGSLRQLFPAASNERGALVYHARVEFDSLGLLVRPGMGASIKIATVEKKNVLVVPSRAIHNAGTQKIVTELVNGNARSVVVQTGLSDGNRTEIVSGLTVGARLVIE